MVMPWTSSAIALLGVVVGSATTYCGALRLAKRDARREAGRRLREAFYPELAALDPATGSKNGAEVESLLREAWPRHRAAVSEFMIHLPAARRQSFEVAWRKYYERGSGIRFYDYHMTGSSTDDPASSSSGNPRERFMERVDAILRFTEE